MADEGNKLADNITQTMLDKCIQLSLMASLKVLLIQNLELKVFPCDSVTNNNPHIYQTHIFQRSQNFSKSNWEYLF